MQHKQAPNPNDRLTPHSMMSPEAAARFLLNMEQSHIPHGLREQYTKVVEKCLDDFRQIQAPEKENNNLNDFKNDPKYNKKLKNEVKLTPEKQLKSAKDYGNESSKSLINNKNDLEHLNEAVKGVVKDLKGGKVTPEKFLALLKKKIEEIKNKDQKKEITLQSTTSASVNGVPTTARVKKGKVVQGSINDPNNPKATVNTTQTLSSAAVLIPKKENSANSPALPTTPKPTPASSTANTPMPQQSWYLNRIQAKKVEEQRILNNQRDNTPLRTKPKDPTCI